MSKAETVKVFSSVCSAHRCTYWRNCMSEHLKLYMVVLISLTLIKPRAGTKCPKHFWTLTILSMMKYGWSILHVNFFFGVKNHSKIKFWGYWKRNVEKFAFEIFFLWKSKQKILKFIFFQKVFIPNCTFWWQI